jgi:ankyrin repeat protein
MALTSTPSGTYGTATRRQLHMTAENGAIEIARMLLDAGADPNIHHDKYDAAVLAWTEFCDPPQIAELVRERGGGA